MLSCLFIATAIKRSRDVIMLLDGRVKCFLAAG